MGMVLMFKKVSEETILKAKKNKALAKALETEIPESVYDELLELVREK